MKSEYEVRFLNINKETLIKKLEEFGATFVGDWFQKRYVYDFNPKKENKWIRLRTNGHESTLTIKEITDKTIDGTKEIETYVSSFEDTNKILEELGYKARSVQENRRIRYIVDSVEVDIDTWPMINTFVEFEAEDEKSIRDLIQKLGMNFEESTTQDVHSIYLSLGYSEDDMNNLKLEEERKQ